MRNGDGRVSARALMRTGHGASGGLSPAPRTTLQIECADNVMQMTLFPFAGAGLRRCLAAPDFLLDNPPQLAGLGNRSLECFC